MILHETDQAASASEHDARSLASTPPRLRSAPEALRYSPPRAIALPNRGRIALRQRSMHQERRRRAYGYQDLGSPRCAR
jgi:hypothetical protein